MQRGNDVTRSGEDDSESENRQVPWGMGNVRRIASAALFAGANEIIVEHQGNDYRLRCTSKGKLILTK